MRRRRTLRRPRPILKWHARIALAGLAVVAIGLAIFGLVVKAIRPYHETNMQVRQLAQTKRQVAELDAENAGIRRRITYLKSPSGIVTEARQAGYLKPGEIPIVVEGEAGTQDGSAAKAAAAPATRPTAGRFSRLWHRLATH